MVFYKKAPFPVPSHNRASDTGDLARISGVNLATFFLKLTWVEIEIVADVLTPPLKYKKSFLPVQLS